MSKTPRTDKNAFTIYREASSGELTGAIRVVPYRVSEQLETELAEARAEIAQLKADQICDAAKLAPYIAKKNQQLADKDKQLADARAEIERLNLLAQNQETVIDAQRRCAKAKNELIEQMREALERTMVLLDAVPTYAQDFAKDEKLKQIGRMVNTDGLYALVRDALSAAERGK